MPKTMVDTDVIKAAMGQARRAPSFHNSQPWLWVADDAGLRLFLERDRRVRTDQSGRLALISCGAVLDHLRLAMAACGWLAHIDRFPEPGNHEHLASIAFTPLGAVTQAQLLRADAMLRRRTDRLPFAAPADWESFEPAMREAVDDPAVLLDIIADNARPRLVQASQLIDAAHMYDSAYHAEMDWWTAPWGVYDGIPQSALISAAESDRVDVGRNFPVTACPERRLDVQEDQSKIIVLSTAEDTRDHVLRCGEALSAALLECTAAGMATCTLTHLTELPASREVVGELVAQPHPQVLIRVGTAPALEQVPPATPRRPVAEILQFR